MDIILSYLLTFIGVMVILKILHTPIKWMIRIGINTILGAIAIALINYFGIGFGIVITLKWYTAMIVGCLGLPGVIIVFLLQMFM